MLRAVELNPPGIILTPESSEHGLKRLHLKATTKEAEIVLFKLWDAPAFRNLFAEPQSKPAHRAAREPKAEPTNANG